MNEKLVLPRFQLPGDSTHGAIRALWAAGALVVLATLVLGLAMWRHRTIEIANAEMAEAQVAAIRHAALAPVPTIATMPATTPAPVVAAPVVAPTRAPTGSSAGNNLVASVTPAKSSDRDEGTAAPRVRHHSGKARAFARSPFESKPSRAPGRTPSRKSGSNDDLIDRLLRQ